MSPGRREGRSCTNSSPSPGLCLRCLGLVPFGSAGCSATTGSGLAPAGSGSADFLMHRKLKYASSLTFSSKLLDLRIEGDFVSLRMIESSTSIGRYTRFVAPQTRWSWKIWSRVCRTGTEPNSCPAGRRTLRWANFSCRRDHERLDTGGLEHFSEIFRRGVKDFTSTPAPARFPKCPPRPGADGRAQSCSR